MYHVGHLSGDRSTPYFSHEGRGVSISRHPDAWRSIARDVEGTTYECTRPDGTFYEADPTGPRDRTVRFCIQNGFVQPATVYQSFQNDDQYMVFYDEETARHEGKRVVETEGLRLDDRGEEYWANSFRQDPESVEPLQIESLVPVWYARNHTNDWDGVWWPEEYAPAQRSAPRGVILPEQLDDWTLDPPVDHNRDKEMSDSEESLLGNR